MMAALNSSAYLSLNINMKDFIMNTKLLKSALLAVMSLVGAMWFLPAKAITEDPQVFSGGKLIPPRECSAAQNLCYIRATVNYNDPNIASGVWFSTLPKNAYIMAIDVDVTTAFNAGTTNLLTLGATKASANEIMADCSTATACVSNHTTTIATGVSHLTTAAGLAVAITGSSTYQTAQNGGTPIYAKFAQTGTAATTGVAVIVITYAMNNDQ